MLRDRSRRGRLSLGWGGARDQQRLWQTILRREQQARAKRAVGFGHSRPRIGELSYEVITFWNHPQYWKPRNRFPPAQQSELCRPKTLARRPRHNRPPGPASALT